MQGNEVIMLPDKSIIAVAMDIQRFVMSSTLSCVLASSVVLYFKVSLESYKFLKMATDGESNLTPAIFCKPIYFWLMLRCSVR